MAKKSSKVDAAKAKEAKQKKIAIVGAVLFVIVAAIQVPRTMKMLNKKPAPPIAQQLATPTTTTPTDTTSVTPSDPNSLAAPTLAGTPTASAPVASSGELVSAVPVSASTGQLETFERFATKDPFAAQATTGSTSSSSGSSGTTGTSTTGSTRTVPAGTTPASTTPAATVPGTPAAPPVAAPTSAVISLNGELMSVTVGTDFPTTGITYSRVGGPLFHLVSLTAKSAKVAIAGGSYADGAKAIPLTVGKPLTLQNTADGTKYTLILEPQGTAVPAAPGTQGATSTISSTPVVPPGG